MLLTNTVLVFDLAAYTSAVGILHEDNSKALETGRSVAETNDWPSGTQTGDGEYTRTDSNGCIEDGRNCLQLVSLILVSMHAASRTPMPTTSWRSLTKFLLTTRERCLVVSSIDRSSRSCCHSGYNGDPESNPVCYQQLAISCTSSPLLHIQPAPMVPRLQMEENPLLLRSPTAVLPAHTPTSPLLRPRSNSWQTFLRACFRMPLGNGCRHEVSIRLPSERCGNCVVVARSLRVVLITQPCEARNRARLVENRTRLLSCKTFNRCRGLGPGTRITRATRNSNQLRE